MVEQCDICKSDDGNICTKCAEGWDVQADGSCKRKFSYINDFFSAINICRFLLDRLDVLV